MFSQDRQELVNTIPALAKLQNACVNGCAELLSKASHLLLWLLHWEFSSKQEKKMQEPISLSTPDIWRQYN